MKSFNKMKKFLIAGLAVSLLGFSLQAATISTTLATAVMTNITGMLPGPVKVTQVIVTSPAGNTANVQLIDTFTNQLLYTNQPYTNILSYITNYISTYTNYYGVTNSVTNNASLVDVTNSVAGSTNLWPVRLVLSAPTNSTIRIDSVNYYFETGLWITNTGSGNATVSVTYQQ